MQNMNKTVQLLKIMEKRKEIKVYGSLRLFMGFYIL